MNKYYTSSERKVFERTPNKACYNLEVNVFFALMTSGGSIEIKWSGAGVFTED